MTSGRAHLGSRSGKGTQNTRRESESDRQRKREREREREREGGRGREKQGEGERESSGATSHPEENYITPNQICVVKARVWNFL